MLLFSFRTYVLFQESLVLPKIWWFHLDDDDNEDFENKDGEDAVVSPFWRIGAAWSGGGGGS